MNKLFKIIKILLYTLQNRPKDHQGAIEGIKAEKTNTGKKHDKSGNILQYNMY